ncbi:phage head closure protein [Anaerotruncus rubiinfantis]|uniref:phage head closure protein n=1 Tax=Anaerotruncus rubiinfantis TaxID=1720200 RepID=UPI0008295E1C|nr:phage head closure protein [Anaerotruncus rubiinfantis]
MNLASRLNCRVDLYGKKEAKNNLEEKTYDYVKIKTLWAEVRPVSGSQYPISGGMLYAEITHKITIRAESATELTNDMYFLFRGQRYDVKYFMPNYRQRDRVEIYCRLVVE